MLYKSEDDDFMVFSLTLIKGNESDLNLTKLASSTLPIVIDPLKLGGDEFSYAFCNDISKLCGKLEVLP